MNDHFGGPSVHCGQILQKNPGKGQSPPPLSGNARILGAYGPQTHPLWWWWWSSEREPTPTIWRWRLATNVGEEIGTPLNLSSGYNLRHHFEHFRVNISIWWQNWWQADRFYNCQGGRCERQCPPVLERPVRVLPARELKRLWKPACYTSGRQGWKWSVKLAENFADTLVWSGTGNAMVRYRIVEGDTGGNFSIDSVTGEVGWTGMIMIDIKWLCSLRWKLLIWCLSYCHPCLAKTWNGLRITWILNQVRPTGALDYELIPGKGTEKVLDAILLDLRTNALTRWPPGLQHDRPSVRSGDTVTLLWCQCPHLYPRPERSRAKGVVLFFSLHHLNRRHDFLSSKPTNTGWTSQKTPLGAPLFCR